MQLTGRYATFDLERHTFSCRVQLLAGVSSTGSLRQTLACNHMRSMTLCAGDSMHQKVQGQEQPR